MAPHLSPRLYHSHHQLHWIYWPEMAVAADKKMPAPSFVTASLLSHVSWKLWKKSVPRHTIFPSLGYSVSKYLGRSTLRGGDVKFQWAIAHVQKNADLLPATLLLDLLDIWRFSISRKDLTEWLSIPDKYTSHIPAKEWLDPNVMRIG